MQRGECESVFPVVRSPPQQATSASINLVLLDAGRDEARESGDQGSSRPNNYVETLARGVVVCGEIR